jgi:DNA-directed RNA polymerase subunit RPC12/RpoP
MGLFKKRERQPEAPPAAVPAASVAAGLPVAGDTLPASLAAHSGFVKRASCSRCGGPKKLPSKTAYLYCDFCGALVDYDFRIANADSNAGITNTIYHRLVAAVQGDMARAKASGDRDGYRQIQLDVFRQWVDLCPQAVSPRAKTDAEFREKAVAYLAESTVSKDMDPRQAPMDAQMATLVGSLQRVATPDGAWMAVGDFWPMAALFRQQIELAYATIRETGVAAMDPDDPPPGVAEKMEYSTFCQGWLPHLPAADGERLLAEFGLTGDYTKVEPVSTETHKCGSCGGEFQTVVGARVVVCEFCGRQIDIKSGPVPCSNCGAPLSFPVSVSRLHCPYCQTETRRV